MGYAPTNAQKTAIDTRDRTLLVSAAAGAGKTTTLTARVIASLLDEEHPADLRRMLIITFTRASAADLREHIRAALEKAAAEHPGQSRLSEQLAVLPSAKISTVDRYFFRLLREHASEAGISPDVRMMDEAEKALMLHQLADELIDECFAGTAEGVPTPEEFCEISECLTSAKNERTELSSALLSFFALCENEPEGAAYPMRQAEELMAEADLPPQKTRTGQYVLGIVRDILVRMETVLAKDYEEAAAEMDEKNRVKFDELWQKEKEAIANVRKVAASGTLRETEGALTALRKTQSVTAKGGDLLEVFREDRSAFRKIIREKIIEKFLTYPDGAWQESIRRTASLAAGMCRFADVLMRRFEDKKRMLHVCDFMDLERKLIALLYTDGQPNDVARAVAEEYDAVYVDEYQDISRMQHMIIEAVSRERNRFMVGDVKQSIYSFRRAEPGLFSGMSRTFPRLEKANETDAPNAFIHLSENFRSDDLVLSFINRIFDLLFGHAGESINFDAENDRLICGNGQKGEEPPRVILALPEKKSQDADEGQSGDEEDEDGEEDGEEEKAPAEEVRYTVREIRRLLAEKKEDGTPRWKPGDIAILMNSVKGARCRDYLLALEGAGIPTKIVVEQSVFEVPEVLLCLCLLNAVDNPRRDIWLAGLLQSPLYGMDQNDLTRIRHGREEVTLWESLMEYLAEHPDFAAGQRVRDDLRRYRALAETVPVDRLIRRLLDETGLLAVAGKKEGRQSLLLLYQYARQFEGGAFKGLHAFILYINRILDEKKGWSKPRDNAPDPEKRCVLLMTVHNSKGLEFPICFFVGAGASFNREDQRKKWAWDADMGMALSLRDPSGLMLLCPPRLAVLRDLRLTKQGEEEMRVLYVALTRAKNRLYIVATPGKKQNPDNWKKEARRLSLCPTPRALCTVNRPILWILAAIPEKDVTTLYPTADLPDPYAEGAAAPDGRDPITPDGQTGEISPTTPDGIGPGTTAHGESTTEDELFAEFDRRFSFVYPFDALRRLPGKLSVSRLTPTVLDGTAADCAELPLPDPGDRAPTYPDFYRHTERRSAADRGTATHLFLQFCDFDRLAREGVDAELTRLRDLHFLSEGDASLVRVDELERFPSSEVFASLRQSTEVYREFRFHVRLKAADFTADEDFRQALGDECVLVQGVIDLLWRDAEGKLVLIDYKTDRLTRDEIRDPKLAAERLLNRHAKQLRYYALAVEQIWGEPPSKIGIYSTHSGKIYWSGR